MGLDLERSNNAPFFVFVLGVPTRIVLYSLDTVTNRIGFQPQ